MAVLAWLGFTFTYLHHSVWTMRSLKVLAIDQVSAADDLVRVDDFVVCVSWRMDFSSGRPFLGCVCVCVCRRWSWWASSSRALFSFPCDVRRNCSCVWKGVKCAVCVCVCPVCASL